MINNARIIVEEGAQEQPKELWAEAAFFYPKRGYVKNIAPKELGLQVFEQTVIGTGDINTYMAAAADANMPSKHRYLNPFEISDQEEDI